MATGPDFFEGTTAKAMHMGGFNNSHDPVSGRASRHRPTGFTLVELVVTLVVIGVVAAFGAPLFFRTETFEQSGFFNEALATVRFAQKLAVASGCTVRVNVTANGYALFRAASQAACTTGPYTTAVTDPSDPSRTFSRSAPQGTTLTALDFTFDALGRASVASPSQILQLSGSEGTRQMRIWAETGFAERL